MAAPSHQAAGMLAVAGAASQGQGWSGDSPQPLAGPAAWKPGDTVPPGPLAGLFCPQAWSYNTPLCQASTANGSLAEEHRSDPSCLPSAAATPGIWLHQSHSDPRHGTVLLCPLSTHSGRASSTRCDANQHPSAPWWLGQDKAELRLFSAGSCSMTDWAAGRPSATDSFTSINEPQSRADPCIPFGSLFLWVLCSYIALG